MHPGFNAARGRIGGVSQPQYETQGELTFLMPHGLPAEAPRPPAQAAPHHHIGCVVARRSLFDDQIASANNMKYTDAKKREWLRTTTNYSISKDHGSKHFLPLAESFQSHVIGEHQALAFADCGVCSDIDPLK